MAPPIIVDMLHSIRLLTDAIESVQAHCACGIEPEGERIRELLEQSLMVAPAPTTRLDYDRAAEIAKTARRGRLTLREAAAKLGYLSAEEFDRLVRPEPMVGQRR